MSRAKRWTMISGAITVIATVVTAAIMVGQLRLAEKQADSEDKNAKRLAGMIVQAREQFLGVFGGVESCASHRHDPLQSPDCRGRRHIAR